MTTYFYPDASLPLSGNELVILLQNGQNVQAHVSAFGGGGGGLPTGGYQGMVLNYGTGPGTAYWGSNVVGRPRTNTYAAGPVYILGGSGLGTGSGGSVFIANGESNGGVAAEIEVLAVGGGYGGRISMNGGSQATGGVGAVLQLDAGYATGRGGDLHIHAGTGSQNGSLYMEDLPTVAQATSVVWNNSGVLNIGAGGSAGGGNTLVLTADTNIAAGTSVSVNSAGHATQTWGPAPKINGLVTLGYAGNGAFPQSPVLFLSPTLFLTFLPGVGAISSSINLTTGVITPGTLNTSAQAQATQWSISFVGPNQSVPIACALSATTFAIAYESGGAILTAVGSVSGGIITINAGVTVEADVFFKSPWAQMVSLTATSYVLSYANNVSATNVVAVTVSGTTPSPGTPVGVDGANSDNITSFMLSTTGIVAVWVSNGVLSAAVGTVVGNSIVFGSTATSSDLTSVGTYQGMSAAQLSTSAIVLSGALSAGNGGGVELLTISGTTATFGAAVASSPAAILGKLDSSHVVSVGASADTSTGGDPIAGSFLAPLIYTVSGSSLVPAGPLSPSPYTGYGGIAVQSSSLFSFVQNDGLNTFPIGEGDNLGNISPFIEHYGLVGYWLYPLDATHALATLQDTTNTLSARVINIEPFTLGGPIGCSASAVTSGNPATIVLSGACAGFTGLTPGAQYYGNGDGSITTANIGHPMGVAATSTSLTVIVK